MFCTNCGAGIEASERFCSECGTEVELNTGVPVEAEPVKRRRAKRPTSQYIAVNPSDLIGFSDKINDPAFAAYKRKAVTWSFLFSLILAVIAVVAFPIYGEKSGDIDWPNSLYYGMGIGGMFLIIALMQTIKRALDRTWDGTVEFKDSYNLISRSRKGQTSSVPIYVMKVRKDSGGLKKHKWRGIPGPYSYYKVGDQVRHHKGFFYYEKYDKSQDSQIMCAACLSFNDIARTHCARCKCPLLKG